VHSLDRLVVDLETGIELTRLEFEPGWELVLSSSSLEEARPPVCRFFVETPSSGCWYVSVVSLGIILCSLLEVRPGRATCLCSSLPERAWRGGKVVGLWGVVACSSRAVYRPGRLVVELEPGAELTRLISFFRSL